MTSSAPDRSEASEYYFKYIDLVPSGDIRATLRTQQAETLAFLGSISDEQSRFRYAPGKWSILQVVCHLNDTERLFAFRALWFARGFESPLPSYEPDQAVDAAAPERRSWSRHVDEFQSVRGATLDLFDGLPEEAWLRRGIASGNPFSVRALAYIAAGHVMHHVRIVREKYLGT